MNQFLRVCAQALRDYFTGPDGVTFAVGRGLGIVLFLVGLALPTALAVYLMVTQRPPLTEWVAFMGALAAYLPALTGAVTILIWGTNPTEPPDPTRFQDPNRGA